MSEKKNTLMDLKQIRHFRRKNQWTQLQSNGYYPKWKYKEKKIENKKQKNISKWAVKQICVLIYVLLEFPKDKKEGETENIWRNNG